MLNQILLECSSIRTFMIVHLFEQSDIDIDKYLQCKKAKSVFGGGQRDRTADLLNANQALSQLS